MQAPADLARARYRGRRAADHRFVVTIPPRALEPYPFGSSALVSRHANRCVTEGPAHDDLSTFPPAQAAA
jgi:hypothetical protein